MCGIFVLVKILIRKKYMYLNICVTKSNSIKYPYFVQETHHASCVHLLIQIAPGALVFFHGLLIAPIYRARNAIEERLYQVD